MIRESVSCTRTRLEHLLLVGLVTCVSHSVAATVAIHIMSYHMPYVIICVNMIQICPLNGGFLSLRWLLDGNLAMIKASPQLQGNSDSVEHLPAAHAMIDNSEELDMQWLAWIRYFAMHRKDWVPHGIKWVEDRNSASNACSDSENYEVHRSSVFLTLFKASSRLWNWDWMNSMLHSNLASASSSWISPPLRTRSLLGNDSDDGSF